MHFVFILAGEFMMGSPDKEKDRSATEGPVHKVTISKPFYMGKYEVTQAEWTKAMGNNPSKFKGDNNPVEWISWNDCQEFLKKLNEGVGSKALERLGGPQRGAEAPHHELEFALPTEAQWEYACRARATTRFSYGDDPNYSELGDYAWFDGNSGEEAHAVGQKKPSPWGLYDMHGNLWEWCEDQYRVNYEGAPTDGSAAANDANDGSRVMRGGTWCGGPMACRSACRDCRPPAFRGSAVGLRCVLRDF
jgi:formylglycine-generating enzyme required for sulfatase activity